MSSTTTPRRRTSQSSKRSRWRGTGNGRTRTRSDMPMRGYLVPLTAGVALTASAFLPWVVVGLLALGIMILSWRILPRAAGERALTLSQAWAIVENTPMGAAPSALIGSGIYLGLAASSVIVAFGLTIVVKRASQPYVVAS